MGGAGWAEAGKSVDHRQLEPGMGQRIVSEPRHRDSERDVPGELGHFARTKGLKVGPDGA